MHHNPYESIPATVVINQSRKSGQIIANESMEQPSQSYIEPVEESSDFITNLNEGSFGLEEQSEQINQDSSCNYG